MTSHEFAKMLLEGPNLPIYVPAVKEYAAEAGRLETPAVSKVPLAYNDDPDSLAGEGLIINYKPS